MGRRTFHCKWLQKRRSVFQDCVHRETGDGRNDVFNTPVTTEITNNTYIGVVKLVSRWKDGKDGVNSGV